mmetsp:Transcript_24458/g.38470  ORF Transcript_24458/g.38470 Transcript_24458/m.38470 type:complete len:205 (-) Transcript_24458:176-790(-)
MGLIVSTSRKRMYGSLSRAGSSRLVADTQESVISSAKSAARSPNRPADNSSDGLVSADLVRLEQGTLEAQLFNRSLSGRLPREYGGRSAKELLPVSVDDPPATRARASKPPVHQSGGGGGSHTVVSAKGNRDKMGQYGTLTLPIAGTWTGDPVAGESSRLERAGGSARSTESVGSTGSGGPEARPRTALHVKPNLRTEHGSAQL